MGKISIVVPIYKVEAYLNHCVQSLVNQTYKDIEIILVDDGSPDSCPRMCDEWERKDDRIIVIHKDNGGLSD
ncbi:MAG: glycosyltransferase family 2 protein, partial [Bilifractor sp.]